MAALGGMQGTTLVATAEIPVGRDPKDTRASTVQNAFSAAVDNPFGSPSLILNGRECSWYPGLPFRLPRLPEGRSIGTRESRNFVSDHGLFRACQG